MICAVASSEGAFRSPLGAVARCSALGCPTFLFQSFRANLGSVQHCEGLVTCLEPPMPSSASLNRVPPYNEKDKNIYKHLLRVELIINLFQCNNPN